MKRISLSSFVVVAAVVVCSAPAYAQSYLLHSRAVDVAPVDAAALGDTLRSSVGLYASDNGPGAAAGVGLWGGALRGYVGGRPGGNESDYNLGLGYARALATPSLAGPLRGAFGVELVAGYLHDPYNLGNAGALRLTAPLGVSLGNPSRSSLGVYAAPYVKSGVMGSLAFQTATGIGVGGRASLGRLALELIVRDVAWRRRQLYAEGESALGLSYRLGW